MVRENDFDLLGVQKVFLVYNIWRSLKESFLAGFLFLWICTQLIVFFKLIVYAKTLGQSRPADNMYTKPQCWTPAFFGSYCVYILKETALNCCNVLTTHMVLVNLSLFGRGKIREWSQKYPS